jgi:AraC family transcriptional regulator, transcriptional activator of pobA
MNSGIDSIDLLYEGSPASFVIQTIESLNGQMDNNSEEPHRHNYFTVIWVFSGSGKHMIDFRKHLIQPHQIFFVSPEQVHQINIETPITGYLIRFTCEFLETYSIRQDFITNLRLFRSCDDSPPLPVSDTMKPRLLMFCKNMLEAFQSSEEMRFETVGAYLKLFLIECNTSCTIRPAVNPQNLEVGRLLVRKFKDLVDSHFSEWHQVKDYASELNVTPGYLNEVIKTSIGQSAKEYIQNRLVLEARRLSLFTSQSFKEIGFGLGFNDPSHFSKFFKSSTGRSLQEFKSRA